MPPAAARAHDNAARWRTFAQDASAAVTPADAWRVVVRELLATFPDACGIMVSRWDPATRLRHPQWVWSDGVEVDVSTLPPRPLNENAASESLRRGTPVLLSDYDRVFARAAPIHLSGPDDTRLTRSALGMPLLHRGRVVGSIEVQCPREGTMSEADAETVAPVLATAAQLVVEERLHARVSLLETQVASAGSDPDHVADERVARTAVQRLLLRLSGPAQTRPQVLRALGREVASGVQGVLVEDYVRLYSALGLGELALDGTREGRRFSFRGHSLLEAFSDSREPRCFLTLGYLEQAVSAANDGCAALGAEVACEARGDAECRFVVALRQEALTPKASPAS